LAPWTIFQTFSGAGSFNSLDDFGKGLSGFSPLRPSKVDLFVDIKLIGVWIDKDQKGHTDEIASRTLQVPGVEIGSCINFQAPKSYKNTSESQLSDINKKLTKLSQEKDVSNDQKTQEINNLILETNLLIDEEKQLFAQQDNCVDEQTETVNSGYLSEWKRELFLRVPRSYRLPHGKSPTTDRSYGNYIVTVSVKEVDNFGERIMNISDTIKQNDTSIIKAIQSIGE
jgi:DNA-binding ferritin-like protein